MSYNVRRRLPCVQVFPGTKQLQFRDRFDIMGGVDINGSDNTSSDSLVDISGSVPLRI